VESWFDLSAAILHFLDQLSRLAGGNPPSQAILSGRWNCPYSHFWHPALIWFIFKCDAPSGRISPINYPGTAGWACISTLRSQTQAGVDRRILEDWQPEKMLECAQMDLGPSP